MTIFSYEYTLYNCNPSLKVQSKYWHGRKRVATGRINMTGLVGGASTTADSQALVCRVPAGAMISGGRVNWEGPPGGGSGLGVGTAIAVGDAFNCARFLSTTATVSNSESLYGTCGLFNVVNRNAVPMDAAYLNVEYVGMLYQYTCDADIILTLASGPAAGAQGHADVIVEYVTE